MSHLNGFVPSGYAYQKPTNDVVAPQPQKEGLLLRVMKRLQLVPDLATAAAKRNQLDSVMIGKKSPLNVKSEVALNGLQKGKAHIDRPSDRDLLAQLAHFEGKVS